MIRNPIEQVPELLPGQTEYSAADLNAVIAFVKALRTQPISQSPSIEVLVSDSGIRITDLREGGGTAVEEMVIVCLGPDDEAAPTNHSYWVQPIQYGDTDITEPPEILSSGPIELAWNHGEAQTETHGLHVGTVAWCQRAVDAGGNARLVFNQVP